MDFVPVVSSTTRRGIGHLLACRLVCRAWVPRTSFHVFQFITLSSRSQLLDFTRILSSLPILCARVKHLTVVATEEDQAWVVQVPIRLCPKLKRISQLWLVGVDIAIRYPPFYKSFSLFSPLRSLILERVRCSRYDQLTRLVSVTRPQEARILHHSHADGIYTLSGPYLDAGRMRVMGSHLEELELSLSWEDLIRISQDWAFSSQSLLRVVIRTDDCGARDKLVHVEQISEKVAGLFWSLCSRNPLQPVHVEVDAGLTYRVALIGGGVCVFLPLSYSSCLL